MPIVASITITMDDAGSINVNAPLDNEAICYYLLKKADQTVEKYAADKAVRLVQPATGIVIPRN